MRSSAYVLGEEVRATRYRSRQREAGHKLGRQEECRTESQPRAKLATGSGSETVGCRDLVFEKVAPNKGDDPGIILQSPKAALDTEGPKDVEVDGSSDGRRGSLLCDLAKRTHDAHHVNLYSFENYHVSLISLQQNTHFMTVIYECFKS
jgi:hypothetical protein